jgi:hypothetical protein
MIGNEDLAQYIDSFSWDTQEDDWGNLNPANAPKGWRYLGSGSHRHAFLGPDGFVYKVRTCDAIMYGIFAGEEQQSAYDEFISGNSFEGFRFAKIDYFSESFVSVCEFVKGERPRGANMSEKMDELERKLYHEAFKCNYNPDIHSYNVLIEESGELVIIDF